MIDRAWEQWSQREVPRVEMAARNYDPNCKGCTVEHDTDHEYMAHHTCVNPDRPRSFVPRPAVPRFTVVTVTHSRAPLLTLPQLPLTSWEIERAEKHRRNPFANPPPVPVRRSKKAVHK